MTRVTDLGRGTRRAGCAALVALALGLAGCGVSAGGRAERVGAGLVVGVAGGDVVRSVPRPEEAFSAEALVRSYLMAAVGGGESAINQVKAFLTGEARRAWQGPADQRVKVIRIVGRPVTGASNGDRTSVTIKYQMVGVLTDQGRVDVLDEPDIQTMVFGVVLAEPTGGLLIDEVTGGLPGLIVSDDALTDIYRIQPIYFWDPTNRWLIPDLRYLPLTLTPEQRASTVLQWLVDGPSPWLANAQRLPVGTAPKRVRLLTNDRLVVNFTTQAATGGVDGLRRLVSQLQWSLRASSTPTIELQIEDKTQNVSTPDDYLRYSQTAQLPETPQIYDVIDRRVVALPGGTQPPVLATRENRDVVYAALSHDRHRAAFVREGADHKRSLVIVQEGRPGSVTTAVPRGADLGRPVWIPGTDKGQLLVPSGGALYLASVGQAAVTKVNLNRVGRISSVSLSPDGRRVAFIADSQAYVAALTVEQQSVVVGAPRAILERQLQAVAVTWSSEQWLYVAGTDGTAPAMWMVTADGVVARDKSEDMRGVIPTDVVAYPAGPATGTGEVIVIAAQGAYPFGRSLTREEGWRTPFFAS